MISGESQESIHLSPDYAVGTIRVSFGDCNQTDDGIAIANALEKIINE